MTPEEQTQQKQVEQDAADRRKQIDASKDSIGDTITIRTARAFHFSPLHGGAGITVSPNQDTIVPAWVQHSDAWRVALMKDEIEGIPPEIVIVKRATKAGDGTVVATSQQQTDGPKSPEQQAIEREAAARVVAMQEGKKPEEAQKMTAADLEKQEAEQKEKVEKEQAERLKAQQEAGKKDESAGSKPKQLGEDPNKVQHPAQQGPDASDANKAGTAKVTQGAEQTGGKKPSN